MLSIHVNEPQKCTPNLLPARINHNGPINDTARYWKPEIDNKGKQHAYFRGRHLHGTTLPLPANYTGAALHTTDRVLPRPRPQPQPQDTAVDGEDNGDEDPAEEHIEEVKISEQVGEFEEIIVWGHGGEIDGGHDAFIRGMQEWVGFAESMHVESEEADTGASSKLMS